MIADVDGTGVDLADVDGADVDRTEVDGAGVDAVRQLDRAALGGVESLGRKALGFERLLALSREISVLDLATALDRILHHVLELTGTRRGAVVLQGEDGELRFERVSRLDEGGAEDGLMAISRSVVKAALASGEMVVIEDAPSSKLGRNTSVLELGLKALIAVPLKGRVGTLGAIYLDTDSADGPRPRPDPELLRAFASQAAVALDNARLYHQLESDYLLLRRSVESASRLDGILYRSAAMHRVTTAVRQVAASEVTVLIEGATGTGKELVARAIHFNGPRRKRRFVSQNAGALPDSLLESELFGHRRGAFTGAVDAKVGLFEAADGGTVFLDEIGEASPAFQVRLLRLLETGTFRRLGETHERKVDVRVIAATHRDLEREVAAGRFRADLFYRLGVFPIRLPALAARREDIEVLVPHFVERFNRELGREVRAVPPALMAKLVAAPWPGNVRQLANAVQRMVLLSAGPELADGEPGGGEPGDGGGPAPAVEPAPGPPTPFATLAEVERRHIRQALDLAGGNLSQAARLLGLKRGTLRWRLRSLNPT